MARGFGFVGALLVCGLGLAGCSAGFGSEVEGVSVEGAPAVATAESSVSSPGGVVVSSEFKRPRDSNGKPIWTDDVVGRGYVIPPQPKGAPPLPQWVKEFNPEMPEAARQPTEAGAKAFAEYAFNNFFYELNAGTTTIRRSISLSSKDRLSKLDVLDSGFIAGEWARVDQYKLVSSARLESQQNKYVIEVRYKISSPYDSLTAHKKSDLIQQIGEIKIFLDDQYGWQIEEMLISSQKVNKQNKAS